MKGKIPEKISRPIIIVKNIQIRLHVSLIRDDKLFHNEYVFDNKSYLKLTPSAYISIDLLDDGVYDPDKSVVIGQVNLPIVINGFKSMLKDIYEQDIFAIKNNEIITYSDMVKKYSKQIQLLYTNKLIVLVPSVVYDENEVSYEGVTVYINKTNNFVKLNISEFESFVYTLEKIDLFQYSQLLINYFISKAGDINNREYVTRKVINKVDWTKRSDEVSANFRKNDSNIFEGLHETKG